MIPIDKILSDLQLPSRTDLGEHEEPVAVPQVFVLPKNNAFSHLKAERTRRRNTAKRLYKQIKTISSWTPARRHQAIKVLRRLRPSKNQVQNYYERRGDSTETARLLTKNYETLPVVHLSRRDFYVLLDVVNNNAERHESYIERELK